MPKLRRLLLSRHRSCRTLLCRMGAAQFWGERRLEIIHQDQPLAPPSGLMPTAKESSHQHLLGTCQAICPKYMAWTLIQLTCSIASQAQQRRQHLRYLFSLGRCYLELQSYQIRILSSNCPRLLTHPLRHHSLTLLNCHQMPNFTLSINSLKQRLRVQHPPLLGCLRLYVRMVVQCKALRVFWPLWALDR